MDIRIAKCCLVGLVACGILFGASLAARADTAVSVTDVTAKQRYPWNGLVDIQCTVSGMEGEDADGLEFALAALDPDSGAIRNLSHFRVVGNETNYTDRAVRSNGVHELVWNARADFGEVVCSNMVLQVTIKTHPMVQLWEGGPYWADRNIGAEEPWEYGYYFWWGDTTGYKWVNDQWVASDWSSSGFSFSDAPNWRMDLNKLLANGWITTNNVLAPEHDAAQVLWGGGWRMPTRQEFADLRDKCDRTWVRTNGVQGYVVRGRGDYASASIFLPAAGWGDKANWAHEGWGHFWTSEPRLESTMQSWRFNFNMRLFDPDYHFDRHMGASCRPVREGAEQQTP